MYQLYWYFCVLDIWFICAKKIIHKCSFIIRPLLQKIGITSLVERRVRGDMIEVYKLLTRKEQVDHKQFFTLADMPYDLRGHEKKLVKGRSFDSRKFFFSQRVVNGWNRLPAKVVNTESVNSFKNAYDRYCCKDMDDRS